MYNNGKPTTLTHEGLHTTRDRCAEQVRSLPQDPRDSRIFPLRTVSTSSNSLFSSCRQYLLLEKLELKHTRALVSSSAPLIKDNQSNACQRSDNLPVLQEDHIFYQS